jgi:5'-nucleotidase
VRILVTNDDGIFATGLWALVKELKTVGEVVVAAPDRERSASGTAVTLLQTLHVQEVEPSIPGVEAYAVEGTPSDCVILALGNLAKGPIDLVVSGINQGKNLGDDVLISGTVGAALQGYLHGSSALAMSVDKESSPRHFDTAARLAALLAKGVFGSFHSRIFLNVNLPDLPADEIKDIQVTRLAHRCHINTVEEGDSGTGKYYRLIRERMRMTAEKRTDVWAIEQGSISITPLFANLYAKPPSLIFRNLGATLLQELRQ